MKPPTNFPGSPEATGRASGAESAPELHLAEKEFQAVVERIGHNLLHRCDRPEIEVRILTFLSHSTGPSTAGVAAEMGISAEAATVHLEALAAANRVWSQPAHGIPDAWHISLEGRHLLAQADGGTIEPT